MNDLLGIESEDAKSIIVVKVKQRFVVDKPINRAKLLRQKHLSKHNSVKELISFYESNTNHYEILHIIFNTGVVHSFSMPGPDSE